MSKLGHKVAVQKKGVWKRGICDLFFCLALCLV